MATKKMRTKRVDIDKLLPIYKEGQINLNEGGFEHRPVESVETGVEKEEEQEHHLQKVINSATDSKAQAFIPTPDASKRVKNYDQIYTKTFTSPKNYIRFTSTVEHCAGIEYCMDSRDNEWLLAHNQKSSGPKIHEDVFESVMDRIEKYADKKTTNPEDIKIFTIDTVRFELRIPDVPFAIIHEIFLYWKKRHHENLYKSISVAPHIKYQTKENSQEDSDPYICFRGRDIKPVRRTRLVDQNATIKLDNLFNTLQSSLNLIRLVKQREETRHNLIMIERDIPASKIKLNFLKRKHNWVDKKHKSLTPVSPLNDHSEYAPVEVKKHKAEHPKTKTHPRLSRPLTSHLPLGLSKPKINIPFDFKDDWGLLGLHLPYISQSESAFISPDQYSRSFQAHEIVDNQFNIPVFNRWRIGRGGRLMLDRKPALLSNFTTFPSDNAINTNFSEDSLGWVENNVNLPTPDSKQVLSYYDNPTFRKKLITGMNHIHKSSSHPLSTHWSTKYPSPN